ncbi:MAG: hypothetical protein HY534_07390 [Chloroflexi bacterium]|nr:hypothetical protein [Chloroflexota bacterium]
MIEKGIYKTEQHPDSWIVVTRSIDVPTSSVPAVQITGKFLEGVVIAVPANSLQPWPEPIPDSDRLFAAAERIQSEGD